MSEHIQTIDEILEPWQQEVQSEWGTGVDDDKKPAFKEIERAKTALKAREQQIVKQVIGENEDTMQESGVDWNYKFQRRNELRDEQRTRYEELRS